MKKLGRFDIAISYADATQDHHGGIYQACSWNFHTYRKPKEDGLIIDGKFVPKRSVSSRYGTYRRDKLGEMFDEVIEDPGVLKFAGEKPVIKKIEWDSSKPDGTPRKLLDSSRMSSLGWKSTTDLRDGVEVAYDDFLTQLYQKSE